MVDKNKTVLIDKNKTVLKVGDRIKDDRGNKGEVVKVSGIMAIRYEIKGRPKFVFARKLISSDIEIITKLETK